MRSSAYFVARYGCTATAISSATSRVASGASHDQKPKAKAPRALDIAATHFRSYRSTRSGGVRELFAMMPPQSAEPVRGIRGVEWPPWLKQALTDRRELLFEQIAFAAEPLAQQMLDHLGSLIEPRLRDLGALFPAGKKLLEDAAELGMARGLLSLGAQLLWGSESDGVRQALSFLVRTPKDLNEIVKLLVPLLRWAADFRPRDGRTAVLLTMGRDLPRTLARVGDKELRATSNDPRLWDLRKAQEFALRDIARTWGGELRTNPTWAFGHRQLTVHGQGGSPMRSTLDDSVTDEWGEVIRSPGLFVMDAAAFPSAVGVNPSATIAAIAERKVEHFIRKKKPDWRAPQWKDAEAWARDQGVKLDPLAQVTARAVKSPAPEKFGVIGLRFKERVDGHFSTNTTAITVPDMRALIENNSARDKLKDWVRAIEDAEIRGIRSPKSPASRRKKRVPGDLPERGLIELHVTATIADLTAFLEDHYAGRADERDEDQADRLHLDRCGRLNRVRQGGRQSGVRLGVGGHARAVSADRLQTDQAARIRDSVRLRGTAAQALRDQDRRGRSAPRRLAGHLDLVLRHPKAGRAGNSPRRAAAAGEDISQGADRVLRSARHYGRRAAHVGARRVRDVFRRRARRVVPPRATAHPGDHQEHGDSHPWLSPRMKRC